MIRGFENDEEAVKPGTVLVWHDTVSSIPVGWGFCDGNNGTPDLRDRMVRGVPNLNTDPGTENGENHITLSGSHIPRHRHTGTTSSDGTHEHTAGTGEMGGPDDYSSNSSHAEGYGGGLDLSDEGNHNHSMNVDSRGGSSSINNQPSYRETRFIMKL